MGIISKGKSIGSNTPPPPPPPKKKKDLKGELMICWRTKDARFGPTQGFNFAANNPNWFLGIWTLEPHLK
jgi:hypothetical protein